MRPFFIGETMGRQLSKSGNWLRVSENDPTLTQIEWKHRLTGERRVCRVGTLPDDQPNADDESEHLGTALEPTHQFLPDEEIEESPEDRVLSLLSERSVATDARSKVIVYRLQDGARVYCKEYTPIDFENGSFEMIRKSFGPGKYEIRMYGLHPVSGRFGVVAKPEVEIADLQDAPKNPDAGIDRVVNTLTGALEKMQQQIIELKQQPPKDPMKEMMTMFAMMKEMREAMGINGAQQQKSSVGEIVDAIKELRSASEIIGGGGEEKKDEPDLLGMLGGILGSIRQNQQTAPLPPVQVVPNPSPMIQQVQQPAPPQTNEDAVRLQTLAALAAWSKRLETAAKDNAPIEDLAEAFYTEAPDEILEILMTDQWKTVLLQYAPQFAPHTEYLQRLRDRVIAIHAEESQADQTNLPPAA